MVRTKNKTKISGFEEFKTEEKIEEVYHALGFEELVRRIVEIHVGVHEDKAANPEQVERILKWRQIVHKKAEKKLAEVLSDE